MQFYVTRDGQTYGPYTVAEAREYLANGRMTYSDLVKITDNDNWIPASTVPELAGVLPPLPAPMVASPPPVTDGKQFRLKAVIRDMAIIFILMAFGGFILGVLVGLIGQRELLKPLLALAMLALGTIGFIISGCLTPRNRWHHLKRVAFSTWVLSLMNVFLFNLPLASWMLGAIYFMLMMLIGGGISLLFKRDPGTG